MVRIVHTGVFTVVWGDVYAPPRNAPDKFGIFVMKQSPSSGTSTRLFRNGNSQAVRIPKALAFDSVDIEVEIERRGDELIVRPAKKRLAGLGAALRTLAPHFQEFVREQPTQGPRDWTAARAETAGRRSRSTGVRTQPGRGTRPARRLRPADSRPCNLAGRGSGHEQRGGFRRYPERRGRELDTAACPVSRQVCAAEPLFA